MRTKRILVFPLFLIFVVSLLPLSLFIFPTQVSADTSESTTYNFTPRPVDVEITDMDVDDWVFVGEDYYTFRGVWTRGIEFDGLTDYVNLDFSGTTLSSGVTLAAKIEAYTLSSTHATLVTKRGAVDLYVDENNYLAMRVVVGKVTFTVYGDTVLAPEEDYHVAGVYSSTTGFALYVDGAAEVLSGDTSTTGAINYGEGDFEVGSPERWIKTAGLVMPLRDPYALDFDGDNDYVDCGSDSSIDDIFDDGGTISVWVNPDSDGEGDEGRIADKGGVWSLFVSDELAGEMNITFTQDFDGAVDGSWQTAGIVLPIDSWTQVVVVYNNSDPDNNPTFYINGTAYIIGDGLTELLTPSVGSTRVSDASADLYIGNVAANDKTFDGSIDNVLLFDDIRTLAEITEYYASGDGKYWNEDCNDYGDFNLKALLRFDDKTGTTALDSWRDNDGTISGATFVTGHVDFSSTDDNKGHWRGAEVGTPFIFDDTVSMSYGYALDFDGTNDYVNCGSKSSLDDLTEFSLGMWIYPTTSKDQLFFEKKGGVRYFWLATTNKVRACIESGTSAQSTSTETIQLDSWNYIVITYNNLTDRKLHLYLNGVECSYDTQLAATGTLTSDATGDLWVGGGQSFGGTPFVNGTIDEVRVYNRVINSTEITYSYNSGVGRHTPLNQAGLVAWLHFNEGDGDTAFDETVNDNDGLLEPNHPADSPDWVSPGKIPLYSGSGYYYLFFTAEGWEGARGDWLLPGYHRYVGVARSTDIEGPYTIVNDDQPILEPTQHSIQLYKEWYGFHVLGPSVTYNPNYDATNGAIDTLNLTDSFTIEVQLYLDARADTCPAGYPRVLSKGKFNEDTGDSTEIIAIHFDQDGNIGGFIRSGGTNYLDWGDFNKPAVGKSVYFGMSYNETSGTLLYYLEETEDGWEKNWTKAVGANSPVDPSDFGELTLLNQIYGYQYDDNVTILSLRIQNTTLNAAAMAANNDEIPFTDTGNTVLLMNFDRDDAILLDESVYANHGRIEYTNVNNWEPKYPGLTRQDKAGFNGVQWNSAQNNSVTGRVYWIPKYAYLMVLEGATDATRIGAAYSQSLDSDWYLYPLEIIDDASSLAMDSSGYHRKNGTADPEIWYVDGEYHVIYGKEHPTWSWVAAYRGGTSDLFLLQAQTEDILAKGKQYEDETDTSLAGYNNLGTCSLINQTFNTGAWVLAVAGAHDRTDKSDATRYVNQILFYESTDIDGSYTEIPFQSTTEFNVVFYNHSQLLAGPGDYDYYNIENPWIGYVDSLFYVVYESRSIHTDAHFTDPPGSHFCEVSLAKWVESFNGSITDVYIYESALSAADVALIAAETPPSGELISWAFSASDQSWGTVKIGFHDKENTIQVAYNHQTGKWHLDMGTGYVSLKAGKASTSGDNLIVTFLIRFTSEILDTYDVDIYMCGGSTEDNFVTWELVMEGYFNIYNLGGFADIIYSGNAGRILGGDVLELYAYNNSWVQANATFRKLQSVHLYVRIRGNKDQWDKYESDPWNITFGMYIRPGGEDCIEGWKLVLELLDGGTWIAEQWFGKDAYYIVWNASWYERDASSGGWTHIKSDTFSSFPVWNTTSDDLFTGLWIDFWFNNINGSSVVGGRVNAEIYGIYLADWIVPIFGFDWEAYLGNTTQSMFFRDLKNTAGETISSKQLKLMKFFARIEQGVNPDRNNAIELRDYDILDWRIAPGEMEGVSTPIFVATKMPETGSFGFLAALASAIASIMRSLTGVVAIVFGFAVSFLDTIAGLFGAPNLFSNMFGYISSVYTFVTQGAGHLVEMLTHIFALFTGPIVMFVVYIGQAISGVINVFTIMLNILGGVYPYTQDIWTMFNAEDFLTLFMVFVPPLTLLRSLETGGLGAVWNTVNGWIDVLAYFVNFFITIIMYLVSLVATILSGIQTAKPK